jgi:nucleoside-diphosphate-sugar epimerase
MVKKGKRTMKIFVTGATGVLGRPVVARLVTAGQSVRGLSHSAESADTLRQLGAEPIAADLYDVASLRAAMSGCEAVLHLATRIPSTSRAWRVSSWAENDRIRRDGTRNLVTAALDSTVTTFIYPSFAFVYPDSGDAWIDATTTAPAPTAIQCSTLDAEAEVVRFASAAGRRGLSLRMGAFYGPDAPSARDQLHIARMGFAPLPGHPEDYLPCVWVDDAAAAAVSALTQGASGVYDIVDDNPLPREQIVAAMARAVGRKRLRTLPAWLMRLVGGPGAETLSRGLRISNRRFKAETGWMPTVPDALTGMPLLVRPPAEPAHRTSPSGTLLHT